MAKDKVSRRIDRVAFAVESYFLTKFGWRFPTHSATGVRDHVSLKDRVGLISTLSNTRTSTRVSELITPE